MVRSQRRGGDQPGAGCPTARGAGTVRAGQRPHGARADYHTYINYKNWLWIPESQWHDVSVSLTVAGATVTLTATPSHIAWDMGNGETVSCVGPGREWVKGMPENAPTNCSFTYAALVDPEGDTWSVSAAINYTVGWTCTGNCGGQNSGDLGDVTALAGEPTSLTVLQRQTVVTQ